MGNRLANYQKAFDAAHNDAFLCGNGFLLVSDDGTIQRLDPKTVRVEAIAPNEE
jgi:hypothetical protein